MSVSMSPTRRISSKSWVGETYFRPKVRQQVEHAHSLAVQSNVPDHHCNELVGGLTQLLPPGGPWPSACEAKSQETV